jgi:hypothetical protein
MNHKLFANFKDLVDERAIKKCNIINNLWKLMLLAEKVNKLCQNTQWIVVFKSVAQKLKNNCQLLATKFQKVKIILTYSIVLK